jgi:hypothetical protein
VPLVAVMIPFDKVQQHIYLFGVHKIIIEYILCMRLLLESKNPSTFGKDSGTSVIFSNSILKWPIFLLVAYWRRLKHHLKSIISLSRYIIITTATRND